MSFTCHIDGISSPLCSQREWPWSERQGAQSNPTDSHECFMCILCVLNASATRHKAFALVCERRDVNFTVRNVWKITWSDLSQINIWAVNSSPAFSRFLSLAGKYVGSCTRASVREISVLIWKPRNILFFARMILCVYFTAIHVFRLKDVNSIWACFMVAFFGDCALSVLVSKCC